MKTFHQYLIESPKPTHTAIVRKALGTDRGDVGRTKDGHVIIRHEYFFSHGGSSEKLAARVTDQLTKAGVKHTVVDHGNHWAPFKGGAPTSKSSHWWVKVKLHDTNESYVHKTPAEYMPGVIKSARSEKKQESPVSLATDRDLHVELGKRAAEDLVDRHRVAFTKQHGHGPETPEQHNHVFKAAREEHKKSDAIHQGTFGVIRAAAHSHLASMHRGQVTQSLLPKPAPGSKEKQSISAPKDSAFKKHLKVLGMKALRGAVRSVLRGK